MTSNYPNLYAQISGEPRRVTVEPPIIGACRESLSKRLLNAVEGKNIADARAKIEPLKEYDRGVEGFVDFCRECLTVEDKATGKRNPMIVWSKQRELAALVLENSRVACMSGHSLGKSYFAAAFCLWWFCCRGLNFYTTAPRLDHVKSVIWANIKTLMEGATRDLPGRWYPQPRLAIPGNRSWKAEGYSIGDRAESMAGYHDENQLIVGDEAAGLDKKHEASFRSSMASEGARLLLLGNGNKERGTLFRRAFEDKNLVNAAGEPLYKTLQMSSWDSPNITGECFIPGLATKEWCEDQQVLLKDDPDEYKAKILGEWPQDDSEIKIIPYHYATEAMELWKILEEEEEDYIRPPRIVKAFLDVAGDGPDKSCLVYLAGQRVHIHNLWRGEGDGHMMVVVDETAFWIRELEQKPDWIGVDCAGLGQGAYDRLCQLKQQNPSWFGDCKIVSFKGNQCSYEKDRFKDITAELHWRLRCLMDPSKEFHERIALPSWGPEGLNKKDVLDQVCMRYYDRTDLGQIVVESKRSLKKRGCKSPDVADAIVGLMYKPYVPVPGFFA